MLVSALTFTFGRDNLESFSCILPKFFMHVTNYQFSSSLTSAIVAEKKFNMADFYIINLTLWAR